MPATIISTVWEYFDVFDDKSFRCKVDDCNLLFNPPLRSTTAMRHLSRKHKEVHEKVVRKEEARKGGMNEEEDGAEENEPVQKKKRIVEEAMPNMKQSTKVNMKKAPPEKVVPNPGQVEQVLQSSSADNVQLALPGPSTPAQYDASLKVAEELPDADPWAESMVQQLLDMGVIEAMPTDAPTSSKYAEASYAASAHEALPSTTEKTTIVGAKMKRQAAIEAEKRIAQLNDWLNRVRKEQKVVRAKRTAARSDQNVENEDDDVDYPVDLILDERWIAGKRQLRLRWTGYDANADSWEPVENLAGAAELLAAFDAGMDDGFDEDTTDDE